MAATVILGTGIIGTSTAYYLSQHQPDSSIHLVEASPELFASASGYAAGFLARDWFGPAAAELGALSFDEHRRLAEREGGARKWGYARSTPLSLSPRRGDGNGVDVWCREGESRAVAAGVGVIEDADGGSAGSAPPWLRRRMGDRVELIGEEGTTAQIDPLQLSHFLLQKCLDAGVHLHQPATALSVQTDVRGELSSVRIGDTTSSTETDVPCRRLVITAGAWSARVFSTLFPGSDKKLPISSLAGHSLVVRSPRWGTTKTRTQSQDEGEEREGESEKGCHAIFMTNSPGYSPEIFSRVGGNIYVAGLNSATEPLPDLATDAKGNISPQSIATLRGTAREVLGVEGGNGGVETGDLEVVREGLCFRPVTPKGTPLLGRVPDEWLGRGVSTRNGAEGGVFVSAGHGPWGISMSLGTGKVLAEMIQGRKLSADVSRLGLEV
ncbi:FAD dependent oxidoreductase [Xylariaceae sp. FL1651]|nr:FAD dependent oxidoreductase [Xylariaceae sp. FL1651]